MSDLIVQQFVSADGFAANDQNEFDLFEQVLGDSSEFDRANLEWIQGLGAIVLGAETYKMFVGYWPTPASEGEIVAEGINTLPKYVFSSSLTEAPWGEYEPVTIVSGDAATEVARLKEEVDGDLILWGSISLTHSLFEAGAIDVVRMVYLPIAIGSGRGVFPPMTLQLRLTGSRTLGGLVAADYAVQY